MAGRVTSYQFRKPGGGMNNLSARCQVFTGDWKTKGAGKKEGVGESEKEAGRHTPNSAPLLFSFVYE